VSNANSQGNKQIKVTERLGQGEGFGGGGLVGQKALDFGPSLKRLLGLMAPMRAKAIAVLVAALISVALSAIGPYVLGMATDLVFEGVTGRDLPVDATQAEVVAELRAAGDRRYADMVEAMDKLVPGQGINFNAVAEALLWVVGIYLLSALASLLQGYLLNDVVQYAVRGMRNDIEEKVHALPLSYFDTQPRGELLSRATNDIDNISQCLQQTFGQLITSILTVLGVLFMMFWISPVLAMVALVAVPLTMLITGAIMRRSQGRFVQQWRQTGRLNAHIEETFSGHDLVKLFGRQQQAEEIFAEQNEALFQASFGAQFISGLIMPIMMFVGNLSYVLIAVIGGLRVANGSMSLGEVQAFIQYSRQFSHPLTQLASMANLLQSGVASAERVFELLDAESEEAVIEPRSAADYPRGEVVFESVSFSYTPDKPLIENLSLTVHPGQTVAIVGPTGAGKTTLGNLIMRFYEVSAGRIMLDGIDISTMHRSTLREQVGMVLQDTWLFEGSIAGNIAYGNPQAGREQIIEAARASYVDRFVRTLPQGYDTLVDHEGSSLSAGERQLITIARAFLSEPALLILDEATSSVDTRTEVLLQEAMAALRTDRTSFVIAHRLSTIRDADVILVMDNGRIVEHGNHHSLVEQGGAYAQLYRAQFEAPQVIEDA